MHSGHHSGEHGASAGTQGHDSHRQPPDGTAGMQHPPGHTATGKHAGHDIADFQRRFWISAVLTVPILVLSPVIQEWLGFREALRFALDIYLLWGLSSAVFLYGGYPFFKGLGREARERQPGMMTLISLAIIVAYAYSTAVVFGLPGEVFFWELATLVTIMLLGHWVEMRSISSASSALEELVRLMPATAHKVEADGNMSDISLDELTVDDRVLVRPGEKVPADGTVLEGDTSVNESMLTGESAPVPKGPGNSVIGGSINGEGSMTIRVTKRGSDSYLARMIELVRHAQASKSRTQVLADWAAMWLTIVAILAGGATMAVWLVGMGRPVSFALERMVTVMVIACPHALGLAIPLVIAVSTTLSAKNGLLVRERSAFEKARTIRAVIFDKTGTLTQGTFGVTDVVVLGEGLDRSELLKVTASIEQHSEHPIARAIAASSPEKYTVQGFRALPGKGAAGTVRGETVQVVSPGYLRDKSIVVQDAGLARLYQEGKTVVFVLSGTRVMGAIALADIIRPESRDAVARLKSDGIECIMVTGDNRPVAEWVARHVGIGEYYAEVLPDKKAEKVREIRARLPVAMVGDGINDAPALAEADVGIAIGAGTDVAVATADVVLVRSNPLDVPVVIELARMTYRKMVQNLLWATGYNIIAIPLAAGVLSGYGVVLSPAMGAILMALSTVVVAINATTLRSPRK